MLQPEMLPSVELPTSAMSVVEELAAITPSFALEPCCLYLVPSASDGEEAVRLKRARLMRLAALAGGTVAPRWSHFVTHAVVVSVPVATAQVAEMRSAEMRGVVVVDSEWVQQSAEQGSLLAVSDFLPPTWSTAQAVNGALDVKANPSASRDHTGTFEPVMRSGSKHGMPHLEGAASRLFLGVRLALGPLALCMPDLCVQLSATVLGGRGKILPHDSTGRVLSGAPTHILCPPSLSPGELSLVENMRRSGSRIDLVTPIWVEQCVNAQRLLAASSCILFTAREYSLPLRGFAERKCVLAISGMMSKIPNPNWDRRREVVVTLAKALGATYSDRMKRNRTTHLVVDSTKSEQSEKMRSAVEWGIPIVSEEWLLACAKKGAVVAIDPFVVTPGLRTNGPIEGPSRGRSAPRRIRKRQAGSSAGQEQPGPKEGPPQKSARVSPPSNASAEALFQQLGAKLVQAARGGGEPDGGDGANAGDGVSTAGPSTSGENLAVGSSGPSRTKGGRANGAPRRDSSLDNFSGDAEDLERLRSSVHVRGRTGDLGISKSSPHPENLSRPASSGARVRHGEDKDGSYPHHALPSHQGDPVEPRRSEWSLEASQSQLIVHRDLTPPPAPFAEPKVIPRIRTMPSRAAKAKTS